MCSQVGRCSVTKSLKANSKSAGLSLKRIAQLAFDLIREGISEYFYDTMMIETVPLASK